MTIEEIMADLEKLKYHVRVLADTVDYSQYPIESLILSLDWDESQIERAHDIFEKYDDFLKNNTPIKWNAFERELTTEFNINYQTVKSIILAFFKNDQWVEVCRGYAMSFEPSTPVEFHSITRKTD